MEARNRNLGIWLNHIETGVVRLPRFQRFESWNYSTISSFLESILKELPVGVALVLQVGEKETFISRPLEGAPKPTARCTEHLLDGQQRLTALWKALNNKYEGRWFLIEGTGDNVTVRSHYWRKWMADPAKCWAKGFVPLYLACPGNSGEENAKDWMKKAAGVSIEKYQKIAEIVNSYRHKFATFNIPFLSLPPSTTGDTAIDVFVNMNTSHARLTAFDIVVAQFESRTGESLHERLKQLQKVPRLTSYRNRVETTLLHVAALREEKPIRKSSFLELDLKGLLTDFVEIKDGLKWAVEFLRKESVFDKDRLPSADVISVMAALHPHLPKGGNSLGNAQAMVRAYIWRAFTTDRYERGSNTGTLQDLKGMIEQMKTGKRTAHVFDEDRHPLPRVEDLMRSGWPQKRGRLSRALLCASLRKGAWDIADGSPVSIENIGRRHYHHLFPRSLLEKSLPPEISDQSNRALNCALISEYTNLQFGAKPPLLAIRQAIEETDLGEDEIQRRLESHLIPWKEFVDDSPDTPGVYQRFLEARAELMISVLTDLWNGRQPS
ncbi:MAG: DUF262 domain-containing protein [Acidimicrobiia bacterium]|nr:DUF262 domain-containing protein [Acidimicrobiia bacterium]